MADVGSESNPLRVAIIGSGPAGFYTVSNFARHKDLSVEVDMYDRLATPFGLVRGGVAPDHQKDKSVTRAYDKSAQKPNFRFYGNVAYGDDVTLDDLKAHYHQIIFTSGAPNDRNLGIPGEDLAGSHSATEFVAWYNGHPDFASCDFDLSQKSVAVIGIGNVAVDVARILCRTDEELRATDMADYAIDALRDSSVEDVYMFGRRGPAQAAFTPPEIKELGELIDADVIITEDEATLDPHSSAEMERVPDKNVTKNVETVQELAQRKPEGRRKRLHIRFLTSPTELIADDTGRVSAIRIVRNEAYAADDGSVRSRATDQEEVIPVGLVFRSVGYLGKALPEIPFHESWGTILNEAGRVVDADGNPVTGLYTAGWIKRGPSGVIGTNKTCAQETVNCMVEDMQAGKLLEPAAPEPEAAAEMVAAKQPQRISYADWSKLDSAELANGEAQGRPRVKFTKLADMLTELGR